MTSTASHAKALAEAGYAVFPVKEDKTPYGSDDWRDGLKQATLDPFYAEEWFERYPKALIGIHCGRSGLVVLDIDVKEKDGVVVVDGFDSLDKEWLDVPESFSYPSISGLGKHILYAAPGGADFNGTGRYRGMLGVDRRAGESYIVYNSSEVPSRATLAPAPEWLCDPSRVRSAEQFEGDVAAWYESLEPGEPNILVRKAMDRIEGKYREAGNDFDHAALIEAQFNAIRLGAEGNPGVPDLLTMIEDLFMAREGSHSRPEAEWMHEFAEGLASGIEKHGAAIDLRKDLPAYDLSAVPHGVPDRLLVGEPGNKDTFRDLLRALQEGTTDDLLVTSVLWNSPRTRDISREWGLEFVHQRVVEARARPEPVRENPTIPEPVAPDPDKPKSEPTKLTATFLSADELKRVQSRETYIDRYLAATSGKGFHNPAYAIPAAWTTLSMAFGTRAIIPKGVNLGVNLWFIPLGESGTGKTAEFEFMRHVLDGVLNDGDGYYNLGAHSSPEGLQLELLTRDNKASMILADEAASFFQSLATKDWMQALEYHFSDWYMGKVSPSNKISLKEYRGKSARTSFNMHMIATPDRLIKLINTSMFETGFLARCNWTWAEPPLENDDRYKATKSEVDMETQAPPVTFDLAGDLLAARVAFPDPVAVWGTDEAVERLTQAHKAFDHGIVRHEKRKSLEPSVTRLGRETIWKCAALLALYEGRTTFNLDDALSALYYAEEWYRNLIRVVEATSEGEFSADVAEIEAYIKAQGGEVSEAKINHRFRNMIRYSPRELTDRLDFLRVSGRVLRGDSENRVVYRLNGSAE